MKARRRRGLLLLSVALASGGLAASQVHERERSVAARLGPAVPVLVAARDLRAGARVRRRAVAVRRVPARFVPPDALASGAGVVGARLGGAGGGRRLPHGRALFEASNSEHAAVEVWGAARRAVAVEVSGAAAAAAGARVDVLVSTESGAGGGRTLVALAGVELLRLGRGASGRRAVRRPAPGPTALATLRVTLRQAVYLTAADNFAREIRLLARPPGDRSAAGAAVSQGQL